MPEYRRDHTLGSTWFFTVVTHRRRPVLTQDAVRMALRSAIEQTRLTRPIRIDAWVLLPDHLHCLWTLPDGDAGFSGRWSIIKRLTSQGVRIHAGITGSVPLSQTSRRELPFWQRRFWEHRIRGTSDLRRHLDYIHWNPVKHGHAARVSDWPWSSFHRYVKRRVYPEDWGGEYSPPDTGGFGE